jgi:A/G-specific adenine glycosylase
MPVPLASLLLGWYEFNARSIPWRNNPDPYKVLISEVLLQQTRVETVIPYYHRWMKRFPTIYSLAQADLEEVLTAWEGLGYYSRARNLHKAAKTIVDEFGGKIPQDPKILQSLPGIGRYTAAAIASIAFGADAAALDGNIRRVLARVFNLDVPARSLQGERRLWELAEAHLPPGRAGDYNQALMDLGAVICTPRLPDCPKCPLESICEARRLGIQDQRPIQSPKKKIPHYIVTAAVIHKNGSVLIARRPEAGLLGGLWEFPGGKLEEGEDMPVCLVREIKEELGVKVDVGSLLGVYNHAYTHFRVTLHAYNCTLTEGEPRPLQVSDLRWVSPGELENFPMGKIDRQISKDIVSRDGLRQPIHSQ